MDHRSESVLLPIYGLLVPFHVLVVKTATANQEGDKSYIRLNFHYGATFEPGLRFPTAVFLKELSFRTLDNKRAAKARMGYGFRVS